MLHFGQLRNIGYWCVATLACALTGCSIHPLPDDVSRSSTFDIVERIRCEVHEGLQSLPLRDPHVRRIIANTTIGYDFSFAITENNDLTEGGLTFKRPTPSGFFHLDATASATRQRANTRRFRILEDLKELEKIDCSPGSRANWIGPTRSPAQLGWPRSFAHMCGSRA